MKKILLSAMGVASSALILTLLTRQDPVSNHSPGAAPAEVASTSPAPQASTPAVDVPTPPPDSPSAATAVAPAEFGTWATEFPREPDMAKIVQFDNWLKRWNAAKPEAREAIAAEGAQLARERRPEFKALIVKDPQRALEGSVARVARQDLPREILEHLERPVSVTGNYHVYLGRPAPGAPMPPQGLALRYFESRDGMSYKAHVFGSMQPVMSKENIPLRGVAIDRELAIAENPVRALEVGERIPKGTLVENTCPVSGQTTVTPAPTEPVTPETPTIEVGGRVITLCNGSHVTVLEDQYRNLIQASGPGGAGYFMDAFPGTSSRAIGNLRTLYIRITYPDQMSAPITEDGAYTDMRNVARYYLEASYGKMTTTTVVTPLIVLPHTQKWYIDKDSEVDGLGLVHNDSRAEARKLGYDPGQYDCIIVRVNGGPRLSGISWGGGSSVWVTWNGMDVLNHECGHSLGLNHANYWNTTDGTAYGNGSNQEYGNSFDVMGGGGGFGAHYNTISKRALGWLPSTYVQAPKVNGIYRIHAYDQPQLEEGKRYAITVAKDGVRSYNIEYHPAYGSFSDSATVLYSGMGSNAGHLLDTTPGSSGGKNDGGIQVGRTFSDLEADMHFTVVSKNAGTPASLDVAFLRGPFPGNQPPTATLAASATTISAGGSVTFTATASDPDGDTLAYHWNFDDGQTAANSAVVTRTFANVAQITAMLTVSDMKGATARRHVVINVGAHGKQTVAGNVTWNAQPLAGVRISGGGKYAYTDVDGNYALSGISTGSQSLTASLNGFTFTPQFANPLTVVAGTNTADWTAGNSAFVTLESISNPVEGGANGVFRFTRTGDTSAAMSVRVSPPGGTAVKTTDYTFTPDFVTDGSYRAFTIPAGSATLDVSVAAVNDTAQEGPETITLQLASNGAYLSNAANAVVMTVQDNDTTLPQVSVQASDPYATEAPADSGSFIFTRTGSTAAALNLSVAWSGTATNGSDYATLPTTVTIPAGQSSASLAVDPLNDTAIEAPEDCIVTINTNAAYVRDTSLQSATVTITDDDTPVVTVSVPDSSASEAGPDSGAFLISRTGSTAAPLKVYYGLSGSALHGTDYAALNGEVTIPAGAASAPVVITPYDDDLGELETETVTLAVTTFNNAYSLGAAFQGTLNIIDNDDVPVVSVRAGAVGTEGGSNATLIFRALGSASGNITVNYTVSGTATAGSDYTALSGTVTLPANGATDATVTIPILNDTTAEGTETVVATITPSASYRVYNDGTAQAFIRDNDSGAERVMVSTFNEAPTEAGTTARFYFSRTGTAGDLVVNYAVSGTATNGIDYTLLPGTVTIPDTQPGAIVTVSPIEDALAEGAETVTLTVSPGTGYGPDLPASATYTIADNDAATITAAFQASSQVTTEVPGGNGEYRDIPVVLSAASANTVTLQYWSGGGTASGDDVDWAFVDASAGNAIIPGGTLTFPPGITAQNIRVRIKQDLVAEPAETAVIEIGNVAGASLGGLNRHTLFLFDQTSQGAVIEERWSGNTVYNGQGWNAASPSYSGILNSFTTAQNVADNYSRRLIGQIVAPATGNYTFWIASDDASRLYLSTDSTAANKTQIASVSGYTSFQAWDANASQMSASIALVAGQSYYMEVQHAEGGGGDHVSVAWQGPGFAREAIPGSTLPNNAPRTARFLVSSSTRFESDGTEPQLMVLLDRPAESSPVTVDYTVSGTATPGSDFNLAPGTVTFSAGEQIKLLPLTLLNDAIGESPEAIVVTLTNASGAQITVPASHTINLLDPDAPIVATQQFTATSAMSGGTLLGTVTASFASGHSVSGWSILAGNEGGVFSIDGSGQLRLELPASLPNPGTRQLLVRVSDSIGASGDGVVNIVCNPPAQLSVIEQRWSGATAYDTQTFTGTPAYSGTLPTFTTAQNVADNYSRRLTGYLQPRVTGEYTFWIASDDQSRLFLSTDATAANKVQIATVSGWTNFQSWDDNASQKSGAITLQAGQVYWLEVHQKEGGGGDHASVAWSGPSIAREAIPASALFPAFGTPPVPASIAVTSPASGTQVPYGSPITLEATVVTGSTATDSVAFYDGGTLIGSDNNAPYTVTWNNVASGVHAVTARAVNAGGFVISQPVSVEVLFNNDPAADPDGDGFTTGLELTLGTDPASAASQPPAIYSALRAWWKFDEASGNSANDHTGRPQDGTVSGGSWISGLDANGLSLDGATSGVVVGNSAALTGTGDFTLSAWVKMSAGAGAGMIIQQREPGATGFEGEYALKMNSGGTVNFFVYNGGYQFNLTTTATMNDGLWHHVVATRAGAEGRVYIDGTQAAVGTGTVKSLQPLTVALGYDYRDSNTRLNGTLDDTRIYERALSAGEIAQLYADFDAPRPPSFTANPLNKSAATEDAAYSGSLSADVTDPNSGDSITFSKISGPGWLNVASSGALTGTPLNVNVGSNMFTVQATDSAGLSAQTTMAITVTNTNDAPTFTTNPINRSNAMQGATYSATIAGTASDVDAGDTLTYSKVSGPAWLAIAADGSLSGTPSSADVGSNSWTARVTDALGASATATLNITVDGTPLPSGWSATDIGSVGFAGSSSESGGTYTVSGSGADIWGTADAFQFASQTLIGDGEVRARVTSQTNTSAWAKAGVMIRDGTAAGAAHAMMVITPGNGFALQYRSASGGSSTHIAGPALNAAPNNWVRVTRSGTTLTGYVSADGVAWTQVGSITISMGTTVNAGLCVTSTNNSAISTATLDSVSITTYPAPWQTADVGTTGLTGRAEYFGGAHTVTGAGTLGGTTDAFRYVYQTLSSDGSIAARVSTLANTGSSARVGVMIRDSLANNAPMASLSVTGSGAWRWQRRTLTGGSVSTTNSSTGTAPNIWVRLTRAGNTITAARSTNGTTWTTIGSATIVMAANCTIGLDVASGSTTVTNTSTFDNVTVVP